MRGLKIGRSRWVLVVSVVLVFAVVLNLLGWLRISASIGQTLRPLSRPLTATGQAFGGWLSELPQFNSLRQHNRVLEQENSELRAQVSQLREIETINQQLREQLSFPLSTQLSVVGADVVSFHPDSTRDRMLVNRGSDSGLMTGMPVTFAGSLVGKVSQVSTKTSQVLLILDPSFRALVVDQQTNTPGIIKGQAGGSVLMERIPQTEALNIGDTVVTNGLDGEFPAGLIVGRISGIEQESNSIFKSARIEQPYSQLQLRLITIITGTQ